MCEEVEVFAGMERDIDWFLPRVAQFIGPLKKKAQVRLQKMPIRDSTKAQLLSVGLLSVRFGLVP